MCYYYCFSRFYQMCWIQCVQNNNTKNEFKRVSRAAEEKNANGSQEPFSNSDNGGGRRDRKIYTCAPKLFQDKIPILIWEYFFICALSRTETGVSNTVCGTNVKYYRQRRLRRYNQSSVRHHNFPFSFPFIEILKERTDSFITFFAH